MKSNICVVICTRNRPRFLYLTIKSILRNTCLPNKIIIVDSSDKIYQMKFDEYLKNIILEANQRNIHIAYHCNEALSLTRARNFALEYCKDCNIITYLDDDVILHPRYFCKILWAFNNDEIYGAQGFIVNLLTGNYSKKRGKTLIKIMKALAGVLIPIFPYHVTRPNVNIFLRNRYPIFPNFKVEVIPSEWLSGSNMSYRSTVFYRYGLRFDDNLIGFGLGEDLDLSYRLHRAGFKLVMVPGAFLLHKPRILDEESKNIKCVDPSTAVMVFGYKLYLLKKHYNASKWNILLRYYVYSLLYIFVFIPIIFRDAEMLKIYMKCFRMVNRLRQDILSLDLTKLNVVIRRLRRFRVCLND